MSDLLKRKKTHFVLWRPRVTNSRPTLVIGQFAPGISDGMINRREFPLQPSAEHPDLWEIPVAQCQLEDDKVYHYWFRVTDSNPYKSYHPELLCADPAASTVDYRLKAPCIPKEFCTDDQDPSSVVKFQNGELIAADPDGATFTVSTDAAMLKRLSPNNRLVIYELPVSWARIGMDGRAEIDIGSFGDVLALIRKSVEGANFRTTVALKVGRSHLEELGANALELLPPSDSCYPRQWGYGTSNYFAPDFDLGMPHGATSPAAGKGLADVVTALHTKGIRFFTDMVMAFAKNYPYQNINYLDFNVQYNSGDPEQQLPDGRSRDGFGADLFKYNYKTVSYDPISGNRKELYPARSLMLTQLDHWMTLFQIDGVRIDSVENINSWDFVKEFKEYGRGEWRRKGVQAGLDAEEYEARFQVIGEELAVPKKLLTELRLDALWNEDFKRMIRQAMLGKSYGDLSFEETVRRIVDCQLMGFADGAQAINYICSHDVGGYQNERMYNFLQNNGIAVTDRRIKLAFACLLTAVGTPMIFAGEEFADQHDLDITQKKQADPVNYDRLNEPWRREIFEYVARLVKLRTSHDSLAVNEVKFIHADFEGKRVMAWQRGPDENPVIVVANFSAYTTPASPSAEYVIRNWPQLPAGKQWREVTQERPVPVLWAGREPIFDWEAKVYVVE